MQNVDLKTQCEMLGLNVVFNSYGDLERVISSRRSECLCGDMY